MEGGIVVICMWISPKIYDVALEEGYSGVFDLNTTLAKV
jgi:hypothetical protein